MGRRKKIETAPTVSEENLAIEMVNWCIANIVNVLTWIVLDITQIHRSIFQYGEGNLTLIKIGIAMVI